MFSFQLGHSGLAHNPLLLYSYFSVGCGACTMHSCYASDHFSRRALSLHLIPTHRLLSHASSSASLPYTLLHLVNDPFSSHGRGCFPRTPPYTRVVSPDPFVLRWVKDLIGARYRLVPCTNRLPPAATSCRPFFITTELKKWFRLSHNLPHRSQDQGSVRSPVRDSRILHCAFLTNQPTYLPNATILWFCVSIVL